MLTTSEYPAFSSQPAAWHARGTFKPVDSKKSARRNQRLKTRAISSAIRAQRATRFRYHCIAASHRHAHDKTRITRHNSTFITTSPPQKRSIKSATLFRRQGRCCCCWYASLYALKRQPVELKPPSPSPRRAPHHNRPSGRGGGGWVLPPNKHRSDHALDIPGLICSPSGIQ